MEQGHKVIFVVAALAIIALLLGMKTFRGPVLLIAPVDDPDAVQLGMSACNTGVVNGPAYLQANKPLYFPPPLQHLNPITSQDLVG